MIVGLLIGKDTSTGVPGKNYRPLLGRPTCEYAMLTAKAAGLDKLFISTDSPTIKEVGAKYDAVIIDRPRELARPDSLTEDVLVHASQQIEQHLGEAPEMVVLLFANNPAIDVALVREGIDALKQDDTLDSAFSVCRYDMFSPARARTISDSGIIENAINPDALGGELSSIRSSQGGIYFCDLSVQIMRWRCFTDMENGPQPFQWMGHKSKALMNDFGFDIDSEWQFVVIEYWLKQRGFTETRTPYDD
jgi:CMP-N-acetylneuraminic acid synthetase